jgi:hypothetical protein
MKNHTRQARQRKEVRERAVGDLGGQREHLAAQRRQHDRHRLADRSLEPESAESLLCRHRQHRAQRLDGLANLRQRSLEAQAIEPLDDHVRRRAQTEHEPSAAGLLKGGRRLRQHSRPARERIDNPGHQAHSLGDRRGQCQRHEPVGPVGGLTGPQIVVAEGFGAAVELGVLGQRHGGERDREPPAPQAHADSSAS